jgi:hypothetical protein
MNLSLAYYFAQMKLIGQNIYHIAKCEEYANEPSVKCVPGIISRESLKINFLSIKWGKASSE